MERGIIARPRDYFALLVGASVFALLSAVVATLCVKFEERGLAWFWAAAFFGSALVASYQTDSLTLRRMAVDGLTGRAEAG